MISLECFLIHIFLARACIIVDKNRPFPHGMASGTLVMSDRMIGFKYDKERKGPQMLRIPFTNIAAVRKVN